MHRCCHLVVHSRSYSVPPIPFLYELGGAGTLFVDNQRYKNAIPLRPKTLEPLNSK